MNSLNRILCVCVAILILACYDDFEVKEDIVVEEEQQIFVDGQVAGVILDEAGNRLPSMEIRFAGSQMMTDATGFYLFDSEKIRQLGERIDIKVDGGMTYTHFATPSLNDVYNGTNRIYTAIQKEELESNREMVVGALASAQFISNPNLFLDQNQPFEGPVNWLWYKLDMKNESNLDFLPMTTIDDPELHIVKPMELVHIEVRTNLNSMLDWKEDSYTDVFIASANQSNQEIFLWHLEEGSTRWRQVSALSFEVAGYNVKINSSGYWLIGSKNKAKRISGTISQMTNPIVNAELKMRDQQNQLIHKTSTTNQGVWRSLSVLNEDVTLDLMGHCGEVLKSFRISPSSNQDPVSLKTDDLPHFRSSAKSCDNEKVESVVFAFDDFWVYSADGQIDLFAPVCVQKEIELTIRNQQTGQTSSAIVWQMSLDNMIESQYICDDIDQDYMALTVDGRHKVYSDLSSELNDVFRTVLRAHEPGQNGFNFEIKMSTQSVGVVLDDNLNIGFSDSEFAPNGYVMNCANSQLGCGFESFEITTYDDENGEWICGNFKGRFWMRSTNLNPNAAFYKDAFGDFRIKRNF